MASASGVVTRFAPSPTGFLHIGSARTALFNWLYAHHTGGKFLLRIEDTDRARSTQAAIDAIIDGLKWLEIDWEGEPWHQFSMAERHKEVARQLVEEGKAYRCYSTPEELAAMRERAMKEGRAPGYDGAWRDRPRKDWPKDAPYAVRLKAPREGETVVEDRVQGRVTWRNKDLDDMVLLRSDGTPTYMLAVVVDDHDMGITHIIRGDDHLTNAARQTQIFKAMGWDVPSFSHIPLIHGADGAKLSKRHGALGVEAYRAMGYLPAAMRNYLARLGWSHGDDEIFSTGQAIEWFDLDAIGRSPSRFDFAKLENLNGHYIRQTPDAELFEIIKKTLPYLEKNRSFAAQITDLGWLRLKAALPGLKERAKTFTELIDNAGFVLPQIVGNVTAVERPDTLTATATLSGPNTPVRIEVDEKAAKLLEGDARKHLAALHERFAKLDAWEPDALEAATRAYAEEAGVKLGGVAQPLRAALTGRTTSPPIFNVLSVLGREESLARIADQAAHLGT
jgi:glutamyl-tRNA synthetase